MERARVEERDVGHADSQLASSIRASEWALGCLLALSFGPAVVGMAQVWSSVDYYSHGFLVPVVAWWAALRGGRRVRIAETRDGRGLGLAAAAVLLYAGGLAVGSPFITGTALVIAVAAAVWYLGGPPGLRALAFPVAFLFFMVPLPPSVLGPVIIELQLLVSASAVELLRAFGSEVMRDGNVIQLPAGDSLFVAEACSGITSIVTLTPLAVVLAYFTERSLARRAALVLAVIPVAMAGNLLRVVCTVIAAERWGAERATANVMHDSAGLITFVLACLVLIGLGELMRRVRPPAAP